ncbi:hypothetical protein PHLCEN_2v12149 [Hermanssonia centrifuga]|uniref:Uncharacterized protein n=1 Tax=Hermanssonia centrifuga TaxID=98765 RepID=A0A2R6NHV6_9APHY|nr:hypothetical protein PHLCEN_2v12149 [Hermanssonia centrifuga]
MWPWDGLRYTYDSHKLFVFLRFFYTHASPCAHSLRMVRSKRMRPEDNASRVIANSVVAYLTADNTPANCINHCISLGYNPSLVSNMVTSAIAVQASCLALQRTQGSTRLSAMFVARGTVNTPVVDHGLSNFTPVHRRQNSYLKLGPS